MRQATPAAGPICIALLTLPITWATHPQEYANSTKLHIPWAQVRASQRMSTLPRS
ncbi:hypothetical protein FOA52_008939 [Chlamydomonas sp. UWO 241]|nr:hypothetical protein FOA52_008939 [Chlamydomonas sp. UWO 241]